MVMKIMNRFYSASIAMIFVLLAGCSTKDSSEKPHIQLTVKTISPLGIFLANHGQSKGIQNWKIDRWKTEIKNLKKMGAKTIWYLPVQFGQRSDKDFEQNTPFWTLQKEICKAIAEEGMEVGIYVGYNDVFPESLQKHPEWKATYGKYGMEQAHACPSIPEAQKEISVLRERLFSELLKIDYIISPITDYGGCSCDKCAPLPNTYIKSFEEMARLCKKFHPKVKVIAAGHAIDLAEEDLLRKLINEVEWIDFVAEIPRGTKPVIKYYMNPEITMADGWGKYGPCPQLPLIKNIYEEEYQYISGSVTYSEGIHDDVNRFAVLQFAQNPNRSALDVASQYCREWLNLSGEDEKLMAEVIIGLGTHINVTRGLEYGNYKEGAYNPLADERLKTMIQIRKRNPAIRDNYRYWILQYRAIYESFSTAKGEYPIDTLNNEIKLARKEVSRLEPEYGKFINENLSRWDKPELVPWGWPRSFNYGWRHENSFVK